MTSIGSGAFSGCSGLTSINIPNSVTGIGDYAFEGCSLKSVEINCSTLNGGWLNRISSIEKIIIGEDVKEISLNFFNPFPFPASISVAPGNDVYDSRNNCNAIIETSTNTLILGCKNTVIPNSVTTIGRMAFTGCTSLTSINIPNSVTSIKDYAFHECRGLTSINIPNSVASIGNDVFRGCISLPIENNLRYADTYLVEVVDKTLSSYSIKANTRFIGNTAFENCSSLTSINIPNSVTNIGVRAFSYCTSLTSINIPNSVTSIEASAFFGCTSLTSINIPNSVTTIGGNTFSDCTSLTSISIPNSVTSIGDYAFTGCTSLPVEGYIRYADTYLVEVVDKTQSEYHIKEGTRFIEVGAFLSCLNMTSVNIPNSVTIIKRGAFESCSSLMSIEIPSSVTTIEGWAFDRCPGLVSISVSPNNTIYDSRGNCNAIIESASNTLIVGCKNSVIPNDVTSIGEQAFYGCTSLTSITIPKSVTTILSGAFYGCTGLTSVTVEWETPPVSINSYYLFSNKSNITLYVPIGCKDAYISHGWNNYKEIVEIEFVEFADGKTKEICEEAWDTDNDGKLTSAEAAAVTDIGEVFMGNEEITSFDEMAYFTSIASVQEQAFANCTNLTSITIPSNVTSIGEQAFAGCTSLISVTVEWEDPLVIADNTFDGVPIEKATLNVPFGTKAAYESAEVWKKFFFIKEIVTNINDATTDFSNTKSIREIYDMQGKKQNTLQKGLNIILMNDGTTKKIMIK